MLFLPLLFLGQLLLVTVTFRDVVTVVAVTTAAAAAATVAVTASAAAPAAWVARNIAALAL